MYFSANSRTDLYLLAQVCVPVSQWYACHISSCKVLFCSHFHVSSFIREFNEECGLRKVQILPDMQYVWGISGKQLDCAPDLIISCQDCEPDWVHCLWSRVDSHCISSKSIMTAGFPYPSAAWDQNLRHFWGPISKFLWDCRKNSLSLNENKILQHSELYVCSPTHVTHTCCDLQKKTFANPGLTLLVSGC